MDERSPLLQYSGNIQEPSKQNVDHHSQFCKLLGVPPHSLPPGQTHTSHPQSLYSRAVQRRQNQSFLYALTATLINGLLLSQVVLGAALTALAASNSSRVLITVFGALNTVIAGLIAFLKSRGQPLRARMFRDDLDRVVDEIESSAVMWLGISGGVHGYDAIDTDDQVTVRSEVARLTRLYDRAVKANTTNDPDLYAAGGPGDFHHAALRTRSGQPGLPATAPQLSIPSQPGPVAQRPVTAEADQSPATKAPTPVATPKPLPEENSGAKTPDQAQAAPPPPAETSTSTSTTLIDTNITAPAPGMNDLTPSGKPTEPLSVDTVATTQVDPDESPATAVHPPSRDEKVEEKTAKTTRLDELRRSGSDAQALSPFLNI